MDDLQQALHTDGSPSQPPASGDEEASNGKRKRQDGGNAPQPRSKRRERYTTIACNECKRRKIKCNGETPCVRCGNLKLDCVYAPNSFPGQIRDTTEYKEMSAQILSLQQNVDALWNNINALRGLFENAQPAAPGQPSAAVDAAAVDNSLYAYDPSQAPGHPPVAPALQDVGYHPSAPRPSRPQHAPKFQGPTSSAFNLNLAKTSLQTMGIAGSAEDSDDPGLTRDPTPGSPGHGAQAQADASRRSQGSIDSRDPIWQLNRDEAIRLCGVYDDEINFMYPFVDVERVRFHAKNLFTFIDALNRSHLLPPPPFGRSMGPDALNDEETDTLKLVLAIALAAENSGSSGMSKRLFVNVTENNDLQISLRGRVDIQTIVLLTMSATYHFHVDDEGLAWRVIGMAARGCLELGLHRAETYATLFSTDEERAGAVRLFWSIYTLDRRWSFGTGMSFALQDSDIDPNIPKPKDSPYLDAMVEYSKLGSKVWRSVASADAIRGVFKKEEVEFLDYQISQWIASVPEHLRYIHPSNSEYDKNTETHPDDPHGVNARGGRALHRLRVVLYLRAIQMRILLYRPSLQSASSMLSPDTRGHAEKAVANARDIINILTHINQTSDIYRTQQMCFNYFLLSALAVLFLAVSHAPAVFAPQCRDEFYQALDLVRGLSSNSHVSKRLWRTIRGLKAIGPKLGLARNSVEMRSPASARNDASSAAALSLAGLAGHAVDESALMQQTTPEFGESPNGMANDLTRLFEAAGGWGMGMGTPGLAAGVGDEGMGMGMSLGNEEELMRVFKDMF